MTLQHVGLRSLKLSTQLEDVVAQLGVFAFEFMNWCTSCCRCRISSETFRGASRSHLQGLSNQCFVHATHTP